MGRIAFWGTVAVCAVAAGTAMARPAAKCARADEVSAIQAAAIQQQLMVAALTCNDVDSFNAFQTGYSADLRNSDARLLKMFHRLYGFRQGEEEYHSFKTRLANDSSIRSIHDNAAYCQQAGQVFAAALGPQRTTLANFVSSIQVDDESPVESCELTVAMPITGQGAVTMANVVVPTPNPLRVAALETAPPATAPAVMETPTPAPATDANAAPAGSAASALQATAQQTTEPQAEQPVQGDDQNQQQQPEKKKKSGWFSGIFN